MNLKVIVSLGLVAILGFLFYPRDGGEKAPIAEYEWVSIRNNLKDERLHGAAFRKDNPVVETYDLGYIYNINSAEISFGGEVRDCDILASIVRSSPKYNRVKSISPTSNRELVTFPPSEARWIQVVINDWFRTRPKIESTRIGARYQRHGSVKAVRAKYNPREAFSLIDGLKGENAPKWIGGKRVEKEVEKEGKKAIEVSYESPGRDSVEIILDLGIAKSIYGVAVTTGGAENNLKQYEVSTSVDGKEFKQAFVSKELENKTSTDSQILPEPLRARYVRLAISPDGWYGAYPEIREVEVYTDDYRPSTYTEPIEDHNAIQIYYDNCGADGNAQAPDIKQGFPFDRGEDVNPEERYLLKPGDEVDAKNSPAERSFCYHYDRVILSYSNLDPGTMYWVQVTYLQEKNGNRIQSLDVDGLVLHDGMPVPTDIAQKLTFAIPPEAYADRQMELHFNRLAGPNAVVSEVAILQASKREMLAMEESAAREAISRATMTAAPVVIDGLLNEWPLLFPLVPQREGEAPAEPSCLMYVQWDNDNLFLALKVNRGELKTEAKPPSPDILHVFADTSLTRSPGMYRTGDHHFRFLPLGVPASEKRIMATQIHHHLDAIPRTIEDNTNIQVAASLESGDSGYILEARIPKNKALHEFSPQAGSVMGFNYILTNSYSNLFWSASGKGAPPAAWGKLELVGTVSAQLAIMDKDMTRKSTSFSAGETLTLAVWDPDRNIDRDSPQSIKVLVKGNLTGDSKEVILWETQVEHAASLSNETVEHAASLFNETKEKANNSDLFAGSISTKFSTEPSEDPNTLAVQGNEQVTVYYVDPYYGPNEKDIEVSFDATVRVGTTAALRIETQDGQEIRTFDAGDKLFFRVEDKDLIGERDKSQVSSLKSQVSINVASGKDAEDVTLVDEENSGIFTGFIETAFGREGAADGVLQVMGERIKATYRDPIQDTGDTDVPINAYAMVNIGSTGRLIIGRSETGNVNDLLIVENFNAGDSLLIFLTDQDINVDSTVAETTNVEIEGDAVGDSVVLTLTETEPDSDTFSGLLRTTYSLMADKTNKMLEVKGNENVTVKYIDALQASAATGVEVRLTARVNVGSDGTVSILRANYLWDLDNFNTGDILYFRVVDADLNIDPGSKDRVDISVVSEKTQDSEIVTLEEKNPDAGEFFGSLKTEYFVGTRHAVSLPKARDVILQVQGGENVTAIYMDRLRVTGETNVPVTDSCKVNTGTTGKIMVYSADDPYAPIAGFPDEGWKNKFKAGDTLIIRLEDMDLNVASAAAEIFQVSTTEDVIRDSVPVTLTEVAGSAGVFTGEVKTEYGVKAIHRDGILQVQGAGRVSISYVDAVRDTGETNVPIEVALIVETGQIGTIQAIGTDGRNLGSSFNAGDTFIARVRDGDLNVDHNAIDQASITVRGNILGDEVQVVLQETDLNSGIFDGSVPTIHADSSEPYDSILQVKEKEVVTLTYIDEVGVTGEANMPVSYELIVRSGSVGSLIIVDENHVEHAASLFRELPNFNAGRRLYFRLDDFVLSNTSPNTPARIKVQAGGTGDSEEVLLEELPDEQGIYIGSIATSYGTAPAQDEVLQVRGGEEVKATYYPQTPGTPLQPIMDTTYTNKGSSGKITIEGANGLKLTNFNAGDAIYFRLEDLDLNRDMFTVDKADIWVSGDAIASGRTVKLNETSEDSGVLTGFIETRYGRGVSGDKNILEVVSGERVTAVYYDALTNTGETNVKVTDSCRTNMLGTANYEAKGVVIDGSMAGWPLENSLRAGDEGSNLYVQWDRDNLYILAYVIDPEVVVPDATQFWSGADALEIHIDTDPTGEISSYLEGLKKPSYYFFWLCPKGAGPDGSKPYVGQNKPETVYNYTAIQVAVKIFPGSRYVLEAQIPFTALGGFDPYKTSESDRIGFNYIIRRSNAPQLRWALGANGETNLPPSYFGMLILEQPQSSN